MDRKMIAGIVASLITAAIVAWAGALQSKNNDQDQKLTELTRDGAVTRERTDNLVSSVNEIRTDAKETKAMVQELLRRR